MTTPSLSKQPDTFCYRAYSSHQFSTNVLLKFPELSTCEKSASGEKLIYIAFLIKNSLRVKLLTHCGRVTQICVFTLQLCKTDDANLRF